MTQRRCYQSGFTLVATIFILVILASLSVYLLTISAVSHTASSLDLQGARAYYAAYSGLEWATRLATTSQTTHDAICGNPTTTAFPIQTPAGTAFSAGFTVTVTCNDNNTTYSEGGVTYELDQITSTATTTGVAIGAPEYATRTLTATVTTGAALPP